MRYGGMRYGGMRYQGNNLDKNWAASSVKNLPPNFLIPSYLIYKLTASQNELFFPSHQSQDGKNKHREKTSRTDNPVGFARRRTAFRRWCKSADQVGSVLPNVPKPMFAAQNQWTPVGEQGSGRDGSWSVLAHPRCCTARRRVGRKSCRVCWRRCGSKCATGTPWGCRESCRAGR